MLRNSIIAVVACLCAATGCTTDPPGYSARFPADTVEDSAIASDVDAEGTPDAAGSDTATDDVPGDGDFDASAGDTAVGDTDGDASADGSGDTASDTGAERPDTGIDSDTADGGDSGSADTEIDTKPDADDVHRARRMVVAGDSWSAGVVAPIAAALDARGLSDVVLSYDGTAIGGTRADQWAHETAFRAALTTALDADPPADVLWLSIGGNDFLGAAADGLGNRGSSSQQSALDGIRDDVRTILEYATAGRPDLTVVIAGYDYLQFLVIDFVFGGVPGMDVVEFNTLMVGLETRKLDLARSMSGVEYAHDMGVLQNVYGDAFYAPGAAPWPGWGPGYVPFPGGYPLLPSPQASFGADGIHPTGEGYRLLVDNIFDQGLQRLLEVDRWEVLP